MTDNLKPGLFPCFRAFLETVIGVVIVFAGVAALLACAWLIVVFILS